jgi:butyrate kinase
LRTIQLHSSSKPFFGFKFNISKSLGAILHFIANKPNMINITGREKFRDLSLCHIKREIADMSCIGGFVGKWECLARRETVITVWKGKR